MTEAEWLTATNVHVMANELRARDCLRALHYFALHGCRLAWPAVTDERSRAAVEVADMYLIGGAARAEFDTAVRAAHQAHQDARAEREALLADPSEQAAYYADRMRSTSASLATHLVYHAAANGYYDGMFAHIRDALAFAGIGLKSPERTQLIYRMRLLLREVAGTPFRPVVFSPEWHTDTAVSLARGMYESRDFGAMPILADALQDVGCDSDDLLTHCRDPKQVHIRGCWVVDLLLGKA